MLGANDGLITVASLMIGVGAIKEDISVIGIRY
jgi:VIT1/CCC1 family predicted Fe2+/Mn2+ transporter